MVETSDLSEVISHIREQKGKGVKVYGIMAHGLVPEELIHAAGGIPLRLSLVGTKDSAEIGIEYLTSATCSFARSTIGYFKLKNELYDQLDTLVGGNYCNGELCATELISDYFNIPRINIVFPSTKSEFAQKFMVAELIHFQEELERIEGHQITEVQIKEAIDLYNHERRLIQEISRIQSQRNYPLSGSKCQELIHKHFLWGVKVSIKNLQRMVKEIQTNHQPREGKRLVFAGNGIPIGDNILQQIEAQGFSVIKNLTWTGLDYYQSVIKEKTIQGIAQYYLEAENMGRMILSEDYFSNILRTYENCNADGIIFYIIKYCSILPAIISSKLKERLSVKGIPYLEIERDYGITTDAQLLTKIQAFKEMLA
ncbi:MAG: 2-hydroxyacyl-CoA dehydratase subunit D [Candidatus Helarchaeota archaeon]